MRVDRLTMGMPAAVEIADADANPEDIDAAFRRFADIDARFSTYKSGSEISRINRRELKEKDLSDDMRLIFELAEETKIETNGYFDIRHPDGTVDPSGIVKGWAILSVADLLAERGYENFYVNVGSDVEVRGENAEHKPWSVGIRNPFEKDTFAKVVRLSNRGIATSGTAERGHHIWNPHAPGAPIAGGIVSLTVIGPNVYEADRFATAAFAMGKDGIVFIDQTRGFEGYAITEEKTATMTRGFSEYVA